MSLFLDQDPIIVLMDQESPRRLLSKESALDLRNINEASWKQILAECVAVRLRLYHLTTNSLQGIEKKNGVLHLSMEWANKISQLSPVFQMTQLQSLRISDFPLLRSIEGIEALQNLTELHLSGNLGSLHPPLRLVSIRPIAQLGKLEKLTLANLKLEDDDVTPLASLSNLKELSISYKFPREQFSFLAKRLNPQLKKPITAHIELNLHCSRCGGPVSLFVGRRMPMLCRLCDKAKFEKLTLQFERLKCC